MKLLLLCIAVLLAVSLAQDQLDTFETFSQATANEVNPEVTDIVTGAGILGDMRTLTVTRSEGSANSLEASCTIVSNFFALSTDVTVVGRCRARYAGPAGTGFDPAINFNRYGCDCWNIRVIEADNAVTLAVEVESASAGTLISALPLPVDIRDPTDVCIQYEGDPSSYRDVTSVNFDVIGTDANVDVNVQYVCCQPSISCYHTVEALGGADINSLTVGDNIKLSLTCSNYESIPADLQTFEASFEFDDTFGDMDEASVMCMGSGQVTGQTVNNNALEFNGELVDGEEVVCMVNVELTGSGQVDNIQGTIRTPITDDMFPILSHSGGDRSGTDGFCEPPTPTSLVIQNPPTTVPPTLAPTTLPPTTVPPTMPPPMDLVCISPRIINGACDCAIFPCAVIPDSGGDIQCETDEWYCYFISRGYPGATFHVGYRGEMCTCTIAKK